MLSLISKPISVKAQNHLKAVQNEIINSVDPAKKAGNCWKTRKKNAAFAEIVEVLKSMCVATEICNYCEQNEATDIEHILPKAYFPEEAFSWDNFLLACKTCNSQYKLDKIAVFNPTGSNVRFDVSRNSTPPTKDVLMINPRTEDPLDSLFLSLTTGVFVEISEIGCRSHEKAKYTLEVLALNDRDALREARKSKAKYFFKKMVDAVAVHEATDFGALQNAINRSEPFIDINPDRSLQEEKNNFLENIRGAIVSSPHPTVWAEIKRQYFRFPKFNDLFKRFPPALEW